MKKVLAFSGSSNSGSINHKLVTVAVNLLDGVESTVVKLNDFNLPIYSIDIEESDGFPEGVERLKSLFESHDAFVISSPEHNGVMPAMLKNAIDWISRVQKPIFLDKPVLLMSTSPGERGGLTNLENMESLMPRWGAKVVSTYRLGKFHDHYNSEFKTLDSNDL